MNNFYLILSAFVIWRITHLLSKEDGPFNIVFLLRKKAGSGFFGKMIDCFYCLSVWIALPFGIWLGTTWVEKILTWFALSGAACLLEQGTTKNDSDNTTTYHED